MPEPSILSIQSEVVFGHVGNGAARFALQRLGFEVLAMPTTLLSNHPGYRTFRGDAVPVQTLRELVSGLSLNHWLQECTAALSGYLGAAGQAEIVADAVRQMKQGNPGAIYLCDPVFGDDDGAYAKPGVAEAMARHLVPLADILAPNRFELASLAARPVENVAQAVAAARLVGGREILVTSVPVGKEEIGSLVVTREAAWLAATPKLEAVPHGTGDLMSALYLAARLRESAPQAALEHAASATHAVIRASIAAQSSELALIAAQDQLRAPSERVRAIEVKS